MQPYWLPTATLMLYRNYRIGIIGSIGIKGIKRIKGKELKKKAFLKKMKND